MTRRDEIIDDLAAGTVPDPMYFNDIPDEWIDAAVKRAEADGRLDRARMLAQVVEERRAERD